MRLFSAILGLTFGLILAAGPAKATCIEYALLDDTGQVLSENGIATAMQIGERPIFHVTLPPHQQQRALGAVACPAPLVQAILQLYNASCASHLLRQQAATQNNATLEFVEEQCEEIKVALDTAID